jgi:hypothetical protein
VWPCWSRCGRWIAAAGVPADDTLHNRGGIFLFDLRYPRRSRWFPLGVSPVYVSWLPGERVVGALLPDSGSLRLIAIDFSRGRGPRRGVLRSIERGFPLFFDSSPRDPSIILQTGSGDRSDDADAAPAGRVMLMRAEELEWHQSALLTQNASGIRCPAFSRCGSYVVYGSADNEREHYSNLMIATAQGQRAEARLRFRGHAAVGFAPDGRHLYLLLDKLPGLPLYHRAVVIPTAGGPPQTIHEGALSTLEWVDTNLLLASAAGEEGLQWLLLNRRGDKPVQLTAPAPPTPALITSSRFFDQLGRSRPQVSAGGRFLLVASSHALDRQRLEPILHCIDLQGEIGRHRLGPGTMPAWQPPPTPANSPGPESSGDD